MWREAEINLMMNTHVSSAGWQVKVNTFQTGADLRADTSSLFTVNQKPALLHRLRSTHIYVTLSRHTHAAASHVHTAGVPLWVITKTSSGLCEQTSRALAGAVDGIPRPQHVERSVLERSAVVITYHFACSACYHQLRRGRHRKCSKFKAWSWPKFREEVRLERAWETSKTACGSVCLCVFVCLWSTESAEN